MTVTTPRAVVRARSALRSISPADVSAAEALWSADPGRYVSLRDAVLSSAAVPVAGLDVGEVGAYAVLIVARLALSPLSSDDAHAVALAVRLARQAVRAAGAADDIPASLDDEANDDRATVLRSWVGGMTPESVVVGRLSAVAEALATLPASVLRPWGAIAAAWLAHVPASCDACQTPGARPGRLTLSTIRAHVTGTPGKSPAGQRMTRADRATVAAVEAGLRPIMARTPYEAPTGAWADLAASLVGRGDVFARGAGNGDRMTRTAYVSTWVPERVTVTAHGRTPGAVVPIPAERVAATDARRMAAWEARETARLDKIRRAQDEDGRPASVEWVESSAGAASLMTPTGRHGRPVTDAERVVPVAGGRAVRVTGAGAPLWTGGPYAGPAPLPAPTEQVTGRLVGEASGRESVRTLSRALPGPVARVTVSTLPTVAPVDVDAVTVTRRDGTTVVRPMTDAERSATDRTVETVTVNGEEVPVTVAGWDGEDMRSGSTAPIGARDRRAGDPDAQVRSFKVAPSPRAKVGSNTGPTVPVRLR